MADGYWNRQPLPSSAGMLKRPRPDYDLQPSGVPSAHGMHNYLGYGDSLGGQGIKDTTTVVSAYEQYLQNSQRPPLTSGEAGHFGGAGIRRADVGMPPLPMADSLARGRPGAVGSDVAPNGRGYGGQFSTDPLTRPGRDTLPLPPDASSTLYIEGLPSNCTRREVAHIFRPFVGYREVRLVSKESKHRGGDPLILCFVDFVSPSCAATALSALQGYRMDEHDSDSAYLRLQFSKHPGARSGPGPRGRR